MKKISGHNIETNFFSQLKKISNLIEFEGPILSHFIDKYNNNYLFYWVDYNEFTNRWLIWKTDEKSILEYLSNDVTLKEIYPKSGEYIYVADIDSKLEYKKIILTFSDLIDTDYEPEPESYFKHEVPLVYKEKLDSIGILSTLKTRALYFNIEPSTKRYDITIGLGDMWNVFENIANSFSCFVEYNVSNILSTRFTDKNRIKIAANSLSEINRLRFVYLNFNSFHFGIAADILNVDSKAIDPAIEQFHSNVLIEFQKEVLDNDFSSSHDIDAIIEKYPDESVRKKIFDPVIKIINNDNINININNFGKTFQRSYKHVPKNEVVRLNPTRSQSIKKINQNNHALMVAYVVADKDSDTDLTLFPKDATKRLVYAKEIDNFNLEINELKIDNEKTLRFNKPLLAKVTLDGDLFNVTYEPLNISFVLKDSKMLEDTFEKEVFKSYNKAISEPDNPFLEFFNKLLN